MTPIVGGSVIQVSRSSQAASYLLPTRPETPRGLESISASCVADLHRFCNRHTDTVQTEILVFDFVVAECVPMWMVCSKLCSISRKRPSSARSDRNTLEVTGI